MTALRDRLARDTEMPQEAGEAMERRLLEAFAAHHAASNGPWAQTPRAQTPRAAERPGRRWIAAAAALAIVAGAVAAWRVADGSRPRARTPPAGTSAPVASESRASAPTASAPTASAPTAIMPDARPPTVAVGALRATARPASPPAPRRKPREERTAGFMALPGAAGLPQFESGTIVRLDLPVASLPGYGVDISHAGGVGAVAADVLVGQDGQARAIRLVTSQFSSRSGQ